MPAFHDFARFILFTKEVAIKIHLALQDYERDMLGTHVNAIIRFAKRGLGSGQQPGNLIQNAIVTHCRSENANEWHGAIQKLSVAIPQLPTTRYGVINILDQEAHLRLVAIACIDDVLTEDVWKSACRFAITSTDSTTLQQCRGFALALIVRAGENGHVLNNLRYIDYTKDILAMYGSYTLSNSVSARIILREAVDAGTQEDIELLEKAAIATIIWNLRALDQSHDTPPVSWVERIFHNLIMAGLYRDLSWRSVFEVNVSQVVEEQYKEYESATASVSKFRKRDGKVYVYGLRMYMMLAWAYISAVAGFAVISTVLNLTGRENFFDRIKDSSDIAVFLLISIFGLVKLTSEDPNALSNLAKGRKLVHSLEEASKYVTASHEQMQKLISVSTERRTWLSHDGCCYGRVVDGVGIDSGAARVSTLKSCGFFILESVCKRPHHWNSCEMVHSVTSEVAHIGNGALELRNRPSYSSLAGMSTTSFPSTGSSLFVLFRELF